MGKNERFGLPFAAQEDGWDGSRNDQQVVRHNYTILIPSVRVANLHHLNACPTFAKDTTCPSSHSQIAFAVMYRTFPRSLHASIRTLQSGTTTSPIELRLRDGLKAAMKARDRPAANCLKVRPLRGAGAARIEPLHVPGAMFPVNDFID